MQAINLLHDTLIQKKLGPHTLRHCCRFLVRHSPKFFLIIIPLQMELGSLPDVPRRAHREDAFIAAGEKHPFQKPATLIVEEVFVPFVLNQLRYDHDNAASRMFFRKVENELNDGNDDEAVGGR